MRLEIDTMTYAKLSKLCQDWGFIDEYGLPVFDKALEYLIERHPDMNEIDREVIDKIDYMNDKRGNR